MLNALTAAMPGGSKRILGQKRSWCCQDSEQDAHLYMTEETINGRVALVTGGSSGIGLAFSRQLAAENYALALVGNRAGELEDAAEGLRREFKVPVRALCLDLTETDAAAKVLAWCDSLGIVPDVLVNDAGIFFMQYLEPSLLGKVRTMMHLHMDAVTELCILLGARMKERGHGRILNISSMTARIPAPGIAIYSATKAYLKSFGQSLSYEYRPFGVTVTTLCPAAVDTDLYPLGDGLRKVLRRVGILRSPEWMARRGLRAMNRGRRCVSPGFTNHIIPLLVAGLPSRLIDRLGLKWIRKSP